jgi:tetratricopeptide (TPR) repeat protein
MNRRLLVWVRPGVVSCFLALTLSATTARAQILNPPREATEGLELLYSGDPGAAIERFRSLQNRQPDHPLGYLLEDDARWWQILCESAEYKWGMVDAWHREKLRKDAPFFELADKVIALSEARLKEEETAEMHFYAGMGYAFRARLLALRDERRTTARAGVKAREHFLRSIALDPNLADSYAGLGLYNYYVDTLSAMARVLRFFMGIPGGDKRVGMRQLERAMEEGELTRVEARFYLAKNLRNYDRDYERAAQVAEPLVAEYPQNPIFHLLLGDINAKLRRKEKAAASYGQAAEIALRDPDCQRRIGQLAAAALAALGIHSPASTAPEARLRLACAFAAMVRGGALIISTARRAVPRGNPQGILKELRNSSALGGSSAPWGIPKSTWYRRFPDTTTIVRKMKSLDSILTLRPGWPFTVRDLSATTLPFRLFACPSTTFTKDLATSNWP